MRRTALAPLTAPLLAVCLFGVACTPAPTPPPAANSQPPTSAPAATAPAPAATAPAATIAPAPATPQPAPNGDPVRGDIVVFAASSLTDAFPPIAAEFQQLHPGARVRLSFGGSSQLAIQLINGARADVFASADQDQMDVVQRGQDLLDAQSIFVENRLMVITPHDNPAGITSLSDLARPGVKVDGAQASVPIGYYTNLLLKSASADPTYGADFERRVDRNVVSREDTVRQVVAKIQLGEADAAVVYTTDVAPTAIDQFVRIPLPEELQVIANYPIAVTNGHNRVGGEAFVAFVESQPAQDILTRWGFLIPTSGTD